MFVYLRLAVRCICGKRISSLNSQNHVVILALSPVLYANH